jgi:dTDP-4-amino-4,6-dideoxygalactose transaminase
MIKLFRPYVSYKAIWYTVKTLLGTQLAEGATVKQFEKEFEEKFHVKNAVALNSGTSALELAYELAGIEEGDEVISTVLTCTATNIPLVHRKARIVFADIDTDLNINIQDVKNKITDRTKAIVFVHFGGNNRGLEDLLKLGKELGITIIEDACFVAGTKVLTKSGNKNIEDIKIGDYVMTRKGYKKVVASACTGYKTVMTKIGITGTKNHPFITKKGVKRFDELTDYDTQYKWNEKLSWS